MITFLKKIHKGGSAESPCCAVLSTFYHQPHIPHGVEAALSWCLHSPSPALTCRTHLEFWMFWAKDLELLPITVDQSQGTPNHSDAFSARPCLCAKSLCHVQLFVTPWTVTLQVHLSMGFSRQEYWSGLPCPPPGDLPNPRIKPTSLALAGKFFTTAPPGKPRMLQLTIFRSTAHSLNSDGPYVWSQNS